MVKLLLLKEVYVFVITARVTPLNILTKANDLDAKALSIL